MELNKLTAEKGWVSKQNENIDKLSVKSERSTAIVVLNGWSLDGTDNYAMTVPGLANTLKILHVSIKKSNVQPGQPQPILKLPDNVGTGTPRGVYMDPDVNAGGVFGGHLIMYFSDGNTLQGDLIPPDSMRSAQDVHVSFSLLYW